MSEKKMLRLLIFSQLFSVVGTVVVQFTLSLYVLDLTGSALTFSLITSLAVVGRLVMLPFCGILADRLNKKVVMIMMDGSYLVLALLLLLALQSNHQVLFIGILTCVLGMVSAFETPVVQSAIPLICNADNIPRANSAVSSIGILGNMFGPILAGIVYREETIPWIFLGCGVLFAFAIFVECLMKFADIADVNAFASIWQVVKEDFTEVSHYLQRHVIIVKICLLAFFLNFLLSSFIQVVVPYIARVWLEVANQQFGVMNFLFATGGLIGSVLYGVLAKKIQLSSIPQQLVATGIIFILLTIPFSFVSNMRAAFWLMTGIVAILMALVTMISVQLIVFIQTEANPRLLGRLMSFVMIVSTLATPLGQILYGWFSSIVTLPQTTFLVWGISFITVALALYSRKIFSPSRLKQHDLPIVEE